MIKIYLLVLNLLQAQPPRIPRLVWAGAILFLLIGAALLIYFLSRLKRGEKEPEEEWDLARRSLFVGSGESSADSPEVGAETQKSAEPAPIPWGSPATPYNDPQPEELPPTLLVESPTAPAGPAGSESPLAASLQPTGEVALDPEPVAEERVTELLVSEQPVEPAVIESFSEDVWAELDRPESEADAAARVTQPPRREPFEPPAIRPLVGRQQFEPPRIERIVPGAQAPPARESIQQARGQAAPVEPERRRPAEPVGPSPRPRPGEVDGVVAASAVSAPSRHKPAGSVLGLPIESSRGPMILGDPVRSRDDVGIGALSNYGKETGTEGGRGGTIALLLTIVLVGGGLLAYLFMPAVHAKVDSVIARLRGTPGTEAPAPVVSSPKAQLFPGRSEAVKNIVKARGAIYNISGEPLENLSVEVSLERDRETPPDIRNIPISPSRLEPQQQGRYEFEYDGSRDKGYPGGYRVTKVLSKDGEVKYIMPGQAKPQ